MAPEYTLHPGESRLVRGPAVLKTVLGSCAGLTFRVERLELGGMCHPMLPSRRRSDTRDLSGRRYVDFALREMIDRLRSCGARPGEIEIKLFGCCDVLNVTSSRTTVGQMNAEMAMRFLAEEGIPIAASQIGGPVGMYIHFFTDTGEVLLRRLARLDGQEAEGQ